MRGKRSAQTYCRICEAACGLVANVDHGVVTSITPDRSHPISRGFACAKGTRFAEVANHPDRLLEPSLRDSAGMRNVSWNEANSFVAREIRRIQAQFGKHAIGLYFGNPIAFNAQAAVALPAFTKLLGTRNVFSAGSQDCNNKFAGARLVYGSPLIQPFPDVDHTTLAVMFGTNPYVSQGSFVHLAGGSRAFERLIARGGDVVWVDPRRTESAERWGRHMPIRAGSDAYLMCALLSLLAPGGSLEAEGLDELVAHAKQVPLERVAAMTGISVGAIQDLARQIRTSRATAFHMSVGVNQSGFGTLCYVLLQALAFVSGNHGTTGGLLIHRWASTAARVFERAGLDAVNESRVGGFRSNMGTLPAALMADEILTPGNDRLRALIVVAGDPRVSVPGGPRLTKALQSLELLVSIDMFKNSTGELAHALLPTTSWLERWDVSTTSLLFQNHGQVPAAAPVVEAPGSCKNDAWILCDLALRLGGSSAFRLGKVGWDKWLPRITHGLPLKKSTPRPTRRDRARGASPSPDSPRFWTNDLVEEFRRLGRTQPHAFVLLGRRRRLGHNSWLHGGARRTADASASMHPADLDALGRAKSPVTRVSVRSDAGELAVDVQGKSDVARGTIVIPHGIAGSNVNALFPTDHASVERLSGMATLSGIPVRVEPV